MPQSGYCLCGSSVSTSVLYIHPSATQWYHLSPPRLGICGAIDILTLHAFMVHTGHLYPSLYLPSLLLLGAHCAIVGWGTALQGCRFNSRWCHWIFFINIILLAALWLWGWLKPLTGIFPGGKTQLVCGADNPTTFMCQMSRHLGVSTSWNPMGL